MGIMWDEKAELYIEICSFCMLKMGDTDWVGLNRRFQAHWESCNWRKWEWEEITEFPHLPFYQFYYPEVDDVA